jgi:hypothetical protein
LGAAETIKPTASHQFYSVDRAAWVHLSEVRSGERLRGFASDEITVVSCRSLGTTERVYNMTVEDEHVYHVGYLNLLAHNNGCNIFQESFKAPADAIGDIHGVARHVGNGKTKYQAIFDAGVTEVHYFRDSNNVKFTVFYNPKTKEYAGAHKSSGQEYD